MGYIICGGSRLQGEIGVYGAKNCALALLGATVLTDDEVILHNCPCIVDVENMLRLLCSMGKHVERVGDSVCVSGSLTSTSAPQSIATLLRGSALILGSTLARYHSVELPLPGGCAIGARPMDIHLSGLEALDIRVCNDGAMVRCSGVPMGAEFSLRFASVGASENLLCACSLARGESVLKNVALEPEVVALEQLLVQMGAKIKGIGTPKVTICGVEKLHGTSFTVIPDRIVAATYLSAAVASGGSVTVTNCCTEHLAAFLSAIENNVRVKTYFNAVQIEVKSRPHGYGIVETAPYPFFPTDMQSLLLSLAACADGRTVVRERLFENRLLHNATELGRMGADIVVSGNEAVVMGAKLRGARVSACDLRGGAGLVIAALAANGQSIVEHTEHIDRGYICLDKCLAQLGAKISSSQ